MIRTMLLAAAVGAVSPLVVPPPPLSNPTVAQGRALVQKNCVGCHNVQLAGSSVLPSAPPFRWMKTLRPEVLQLVAAQAGRGDHAGMPQIFLTKSESEAIAAYIRAFANGDPATQRTLGIPACLARSC